MSDHGEDGSIPSGDPSGFVDPPEETTPGPMRQRPKWFVPVVSAAAIAVLIVVGFGVFALFSGGSSGYSITGTFTLDATSGIVSPAGTGGPCYGKGGYDDIETGLGVKVTDGNGKVIAVGSLTDPTDVQNPNYPILHKCVFTITIPKRVPKTDFYSVEVGRRGEITKSFDEMRRSDWTVALTLG